MDEAKFLQHILQEAMRVPLSQDTSIAARADEIHFLNSILPQARIDEWAKRGVTVVRAVLQKGKEHVTLRFDITNGTTSILRAIYDKRGETSEIVVKIDNKPYPRPVTMTKDFLAILQQLVEKALAQSEAGPAVALP